MTANPASLRVEHNEAGLLAQRSPPRILLLLGSKAGDNAQIRALCEHIFAHGQSDTVTLKFNPLHVLPNALLPRLRLNLKAASRRTLDRLHPPELVISAGKRSYRAAYRLKATYGHAITWLHIGRPWGPIAPIDVVVTTPQYRLPPRANIVRLPYPICTTVVDAVARRSTSRELAVLVGGNSTSQHLGPLRAVALCKQAQTLASRLGLRPVLLTSARTPSTVTAALVDAAGPDLEVVSWTPQPAGATSSPYRELLARADAFLVTSDSASMLADAFDSGRPVYVFEVAERKLTHGIHALAEFTKRYLRAPACLSRLATRAVVAGLITPPRRMPILLQALARHADVPFDAMMRGERPLRRDGRASSLSIAGVEIRRLTSSGSAQAPARARGSDGLVRARMS